MSFNVENTSGSALDINDLGITLSTGAIVDLSQTTDPQTLVISANGGDIETLINASDLTVKDPIDGVTNLSAADGLAVARSLNDPHWRLGGGARIADAQDVDATGVSSGDVLQWNGSTWIATDSDDTDRVQNVWVGKHGNDSNDGLTPSKAKLTIGAAITTASALTPSTSNRVAITCNDGGTYAESFTVPSWVTLTALDATVEGTITLSDNCEVAIKEVYKATSGEAITKPGGTTAAFITADIVRADGTADAVVNGAATSIIIIHARQVFCEDGTAILDNSTGTGHIHLDVEDLYITGSGTGIDRASSTGAIQGRVSHILDIGPMTGTAIDISTGNVNINVGTIRTNVVWNVAGAGSLQMFVNEIVSGSKIQTSGAARVNVFEAKQPRWLPIDDGDSPFLADRFGFYAINTSSDPVTLQLPTPASDGDNVSFYDVAKTFGTNNFTIDGNSSTIDGLASQTLSVDGASGIVIYSVALGEWSLKRIQDEVGSSPSNVIYVTKNGNDITGTGSFSNPYLTVAKGVSVANAQATALTPATVKVLAGVYNEVNPINMTNEYVIVQGDQETSVIIEPTVDGSDLFVCSSGTSTLGPSIDRCALQGTAGFKTAGSSLIRVEGDGRFVFDKVNLYDGGIGIEAGQGTISTEQEVVWDFATAQDCTTAIDVSQNAKMAMQVVFLRGNDSGIIARNTSSIEIGNFSIQNAEGVIESGMGVDLNDSAMARFISGQIRNCVTGVEINDSATFDAGSVFFFNNTNDFNQVDTTAEVLISGGSLDKDSLLISNGDLVSLNYLDTTSNDVIIGSAESTGTPGLEFRVRQADGRVFIGDNATNANAPTNTVGGSRTVNLVDSNGNFRIWRWDATPGLHPAFEWLKGTNTFVADDEGDAPITAVTGGANGIITIDLSGTDYNDPLDPTPGSDRTTLDTRVFFPGAEVRVNGTPSDDGDYVVQSSTYNSGPQTIDVTMTTAMTGGGTGTAVFGGGAGRPDGISTYVGDPSSAIAAGVGDVHWDMLLRETDSFAIRRRTGGGGTGSEHFRFFLDRTEFQNGPAYDSSDNSLSLVVEGVTGTGGGTTDVNYLTIRNAAPGDGPEVEAVGSDTNVDIEMIPKGTGTILVPSGYEANIVDDSLITKAYVDSLGLQSPIQFFHHNGASTQTFSAATTILVNTAVRADTGYSYTTGEVTIANDGWYEITYDVTADNAAGSRTTGTHFLEVNTVLVPGSVSNTYHRNAANGEDTGSATVLVNLTASDVVRVRSSATANITTIANGCRLRIESKQ